MENPKWSDIMYIYDCETVYNRKTAIDKGFWNTSPVYTALTESKLKMTYVVVKTISLIEKLSIYNSNYI
ncbi:hypothetical protein [Clostridium botulinum]|uniref:Uncharacterized protein n=1 Tax=Clostridium botulinum TaxID=1491 RepID=A0A1L7JN95_CLOBO|nr:hypothetical protein [Clostridium botulinum]APU86945.1 hypothetical protein NPD8_3857 [Clostridium botulinum]